MPRFCEVYPDICLTTEEKHGKPSVRVVGEIWIPYHWLSDILRNFDSSLAYVWGNTITINFGYTNWCLWLSKFKVNHLVYTPPPIFFAALHCFEHACSDLLAFPQWSMYIHQHSSLSLCWLGYHSDSRYVKVFATKFLNFTVSTYISVCLRSAGIYKQHLVVCHLPFCQDDLTIFHCIRLLHHYLHVQLSPYAFTVNCIYSGAGKSLARPTSRCILFDGENISFDASLVICMYVCMYIYIVLIFLQLWL